MRMTPIVMIALICAACRAPAASAVPEARLARALSAERTAAVERRRAHNEALRGLFRRLGLPDGSDGASVEARATALPTVTAARAADDKEKQELLGELKALGGKPTKKALDAIILKYEKPAK